MNPQDSSSLNTRIDRVEVFRVSVPLLEPQVVFGAAVMTAREFVIARAYAAGQCGTGFGFTRGAAADRIAEQQIVPFVVDQPLGSIRQIWNQVRQSVNFVGEIGHFARALSAVDIALWDLLAKTLNVPLWRLIGGVSAQVPCIAIAGYYRPGDSLTPLKQEAERLMTAGYNRLKIPFGHGLALDRKRLTVLREVVGPDVIIGVDGHGSFNSVKQALEAWNNIEPFNIDYFEDPFPPSFWELAIMLAQSSSVRVAYGENIALPSMLQRLGSPGGIDIVRPDATYALGISGYMQAVAPALENRVTVFPHYFPDVHASLVGGLGGAWVEESPAEADTVNFQALRAEQPKIRDGVWYLSDKPGLGIEWDEDALKKFRVDK